MILQKAVRVAVTGVMEPVLALLTVPDCMCLVLMDELTVVALTSSGLYWEVCHSQSSSRLF